MNLRENTNTHKFTGETRNGLWGKFISHELSQELSNEWTREKKSLNRFNQSPDVQNQHQQKSKIKLRQESKRSWQNALLPELERDREIRKVLDSLTISDRDYETIKKRGFSHEQILDNQYKSVQVQQPLAEKTSLLLAGVTADGLSLNNKIAGILIPIKNEKGYYTGWQYRLNANFKNKYLWAKTKVDSRNYDITSHQKESLELPLAYCTPNSSEKLDSKYIGLTEGVGFKPQLTANKYNQIVLGASGGMFASSPQTFERQLKTASNKLGSKDILIYPDAGAVQNTSVLRQYSNTVNFLNQKGYKIHFAWWEQTDKKQHKDIDEISGIQKIDVIDAERFFSIGKEYSGWHPTNESEKLNHHNKVVLNQNEIANKFAERLIAAISEKELRQTIEHYQNQFSNRSVSLEQPNFKQIKELAWGKLDRKQKAKVNSFLSEVEVLPLNKKDSIQQKRVEQLAPVFLDYLRLDNKPRKETQNACVEYDPKSKIIFYQNKNEQSQYLKAQYINDKWLDRGSNISQAKELEILDKVAPKVKQRLQQKKMKQEKLNSSNARSRSRRR